MNYPFVCTRVRARRSILFDREDYRHLAGMADLPQLFEALMGTHYGAYVQEFGSRFEGLELLHHVTLSSLGAEYHSVYRMLDGDLREKLLPIFLKLDMFNLLSVIRAREGSISAEELKFILIPSPVTDFRRLADIFKSDFDGFLRALSNSPLLRGTEGLSPVEMENAVVMNWLDLVSRISLTELRKYVRLIQDVHSRLTGLKRRAVAGEPISPLLEGELEASLLRFGARLMRMNPLSAAPIVSYLNSKDIEARNLRVIGYGVFSGLPEAEIMEGVILENRSAG